MPATAEVTRSRLRRSPPGLFEKLPVRAVFGEVLEDCAANDLVDVDQNTGFPGVDAS